MNKLLTLTTYCLLLTVYSSQAQFSKVMDFPNNGYGINGDDPLASLFFDGTYFYGTTQGGGTTDFGTIFKVLPDGTGYVDLFNFTGTADGKWPQCSLISDGTFLYGTTFAGGTNDLGTIFKIMPDGSGYTLLFSFIGGTGSNPKGSLIYDGTFLYGTASDGNSTNGTVFKIKPDGTGYTAILYFNGTSNGRAPYGSPITDGTFLYGVTFGGGINSYGVIFKIKPDGTGYVKLYDFSTGSDGKFAWGSLVSDGTFLYGMTMSGGVGNFGTIFKIQTNGTGYLKIFDFNNTGSGKSPNSNLIYDGTYLYGLTQSGGVNDKGVAFKIKPDGSNFIKLLDFDGAGSGAIPIGSFISVGTTLYGMAADGGAVNRGTLIKLNTDGTGYAKLLDFAGIVNAQSPRSTGALVFDGTYFYGMTPLGGGRPGYAFGVAFKVKPDGTEYSTLHRFDGGTTDGASPYGSLVAEGDYLYGMTQTGGANGLGTIFKIKPDGTGYSMISSFAVNGVATGASPQGALISDGTYLYGMTYSGGTNQNGAIFKVLLNGTGFVKLHDFNITDGNGPQGSLLLHGGMLYGMAWHGGSNDIGTIFKLNTDGTGFTTLLDFAGAANGSSPIGSLISDGTFLYGMTKQGGTTGNGVVFKIMPNGTGFTKLIDFALSTTPYGGAPQGDLLYDGTFLFGMNDGWIFKVKPDGTGYDDLFQFGNVETGSNPKGTLVSVGNLLYGVTGFGGTDDKGTLFNICPQVRFAQAPTICSEESLTIGIHTYSADGTYIDTLVGITTCDSIVTTVLTKLPANAFDQTLTICSPQTLTVGTSTYSQSGDFTDVLTSLVTGCDSTVTTHLTVDICIGINTTELNRFSIYPSPSHTSATIETQLSKGIYQLLDITGKILLQGTITSTKFTLDISSLSSGVYFISIMNENRQMRGKMVKE